MMNLPELNESKSLAPESEKETTGSSVVSFFSRHHLNVLFIVHKTLMGSYDTIYFFTTIFFVAEKEPAVML